MIIKRVEDFLFDIYGLYHKNSYISPDPLQFLYNYSDKSDIEICGLIASSFAVGRVDMILKCVDHILSQFGNLTDSIKSGTLVEFNKIFKDFKYRFYDGFMVAYFLDTIRKILLEYGSLENLFVESVNSCDTYLEAQNIFSKKLREYGAKNCGALIPDPDKKSASKRLNLFFRWMIRKDEIDLGVWNYSPKDLIVPLDTHIFRISKIIGLTDRNSADLKTALDITENLKKIDFDDPVKFDFSISRIGIHPDLDYKIFNKYKF